MAKSFSARVLARAADNTLRFYGDDWRQASITTVVSMAIGLLAYLYFFGWASAMEQAIQIAAFVLAPVGLLTLTLFLGYLALAPAELIYEAIENASRGSATPSQQTPARVAPKPKPPNYAIWKQRAEYTLREFASLLADIDPYSHDPNADRSAYLHLLHEAAEKGTLDYIPEWYDGYRGIRAKPVNDDTKIQKADAIKWAEQNGFDPTKFKPPRSQ